MKYSTLFTLLAVGFARTALATDAPPTDAVLLERAKVDDAFEKGMPLLINTSYKIMAGRRVMPGNVEIHEHDTDIFYVTEGSATFVTGGTAVEPKATKAGEMMAKSITGGVEHHLQRGDVIVIPSGVPHQFTEVSGTFLYFVVKVTK
jgi:mannose-6-phosphate isomerase-like protein (cupin superfamily)